MKHMVDAWVFRTGRHGERDTWALNNGVTGGGWEEYPDLSEYQSRDAIAKLVEDLNPGATQGTLTTSVSQLWALRARIQPGDIMVLPLKTTREIAIGIVQSGYEYLEDTDPTRRHAVRVDWKVQDLPRSAVKQDLLYTLGSSLTVFSPSRGKAVERLQNLMTERVDPGQIPYSSKPSLASSVDPDVNEAETRPDIEEVARDQIRVKIGETFKGHDLTVLISAILEAEGFVCTPSTGGADGGVDIVAGRGLLGMETPRIIVQVKSGGQVTDSVFRDLLGAMQHAGNADQGLLVSWDGVSSAVRQSLQRERFRVRLWTAEEVVDAVLQSYPKLPEDIRSELQLRRVWMLAE